MVTVTLVALAGKLTVDGTVAILVSLEVRLMITPEAGAGDERVRVTFCDPTPAITTVEDENATVAPTRMDEVAGVYPGADTPMVVVPRLPPVICGWDAGAVWPAAIATVPGFTVTFSGSALVRVTVTPGAGAGEDRLTANGTTTLGPTVTLGGTTRAPGAATVTVAVASGTNCDEVARMTAMPGPVLV